MTRGILIAGNESSLFSAAAAEAAKRVESFASVLISNRLPLPEGGGVTPARAELPAGAIPLSWNSASPISARTLVLAAENRLTQINDAILICSPPALFKSIEAVTPEEIDALVNDHIRGWFFLIRELAQYFRGSGSGSLSFVAQEISGGDKSRPWKQMEDLAVEMASEEIAKSGGGGLWKALYDQMIVNVASGMKQEEADG